MHNLFNVIALIIGGINLTLIILILIRSQIKRQIAYFLLFELFLSIWIIFGVLSNYPINKQLSSIFFNVYFFSAPLATISFLLFTLEFPRNLINNKIKPFIYLVIGTGIFFAVLSVSSNLIIESTNITNLGIAYKQGPLDIPYAIFHVSIILAGIAVMIKQYKTASGQNKLQAYYFLIGFIVSGTFLIVFNLILWRITNLNYSEDPLVVSILPNIGRSSVSFLTAIAVYALIRHRLFGIRVILGELIFWIAGSALTFIFFYATILLELRIFGNLTDPVVILLNIVIALLAFPLLRSTNNHIRRLIRRFTINVTFDQEHVLKEYTTEIVQSETTEDIVTRLFNVLDDCYHPSSTGILLIDQETGSITSQWRGLTTEEIAKIEDEDTINSLINSVGTRPDTMLKVDAVLPITLKKYAGVCVLGAKKGNETYTSEDVRFLEQILETTALNLNRTIK